MRKTYARLKRVSSKHFLTKYETLNGFNMALIVCVLLQVTKGKTINIRYLRKLISIFLLDGNVAIPQTGIINQDQKGIKLINFKHAICRFWRNLYNARRSLYHCNVTRLYWFALW